jgi:hypothetical protein
MRRRNVVGFGSRALGPWARRGLIALNVALAVGLAGLLVPLILGVAIAVRPTARDRAAAAAVALWYAGSLAAFIRTAAVLRREGRWPAALQAAPLAGLVALGAVEWALRA